MINHIRGGGEYDLMGGQKTLTIGVTVNLEHYENLRLEVSGEVDTPQDAESLSRFLDTILGRFGRNDPATAERVNSYRKRVFPESGDTVAREHGSLGIVPPPVLDDQGQKPAAGPISPTAGPTSHENPLASADAPTVDPPAVPAATCESCSAPVSPAEQKMSQIFASRTLCRVCMKNLQIDTKGR